MELLFLLSRAANATRRWIVNKKRDESTKTCRIINTLAARDVYGY